MPLSFQTGKIGWLGLSLAIVTTAFMVMTYLIAIGTPADPNSHSPREAEGCLSILHLVFMGLPSLVFALISCSLGLVSLVGSIREQRNLFAPIATLVLSVFSFILFGLM